MTTSLKDRTSIAKREIPQMVKRIVELFDPDKVILFGSYARGEANEDSDVDLLVVMNVKGDKRETRIKVRSALHQFHTPADVIVTRPEDFDWRQHVAGTIEYPATREGKILYARR